MNSFLDEHSGRFDEPSPCCIYLNIDNSQYVSPFENDPNCQYNVRHEICTFAYNLMVSLVAYRFLYLNDVPGEGKSSLLQTRVENTRKEETHSNSLLHSHYVAVQSIRSVLICSS